MCQPSPGLRGTGAHPRQRSPSDHADGPRRRAGDDSPRSYPPSGDCHPRLAGSLLPVDPRLPGAVPARLADAQAEGDEARPSRVVAGGRVCCLECPPGEPPTALTAAMDQHPLADEKDELDAAAAENDAEGKP